MESISAWQLGRWMEFHRLEPWGSEVEALRFGGVAAMTYNCAMGSRGGKSAVDFAIGLPPTKQASIADKIRAWAAAMAPRAASAAAAAHVAPATGAESRST